MVDGGNKHWAYTPKEEITLPTAILESVLPATTVYEHSFPYVGTIEIPNAFIQTYFVYCFITMRLRGKIADMLANIVS